MVIAPGKAYMSDRPNAFPEAPDWFTDAIGQRPVFGETLVDGIPIATRTWGTPGEVNLVLVHGGAAHSGWWDHIAPALVRGCAVVALDLSGHGDSGRRDSYAGDEWAREVLAVSEAAGFRDPILIGHSLGGLVSLRAAKIAEFAIGGVIVIDSPIGESTPEDTAATRQFAVRSPSVYPTAEAAIARFRPVPDQPTLPYIAAHVAAESIREVAGGWSWKFDGGIFPAPTTTPALLTDPGCPIAFFIAENGIVSRRNISTIAAGSERPAAIIDVPDAGHAIMLDQPLALITGIRAVLATWKTQNISSFVGEAELGLDTLA
jgi:pimeloyl-ACP methyl ester carboxylesterase